METRIYGTNVRTKRFKGECIVAFVDFLGFSNEIKNKWHDEDNNPLNRLLNFVKNINRNISRGIRQRIPAGDKYTLNGCRIKTFSDSTIIAYCFDHEPDNVELLIGILYVAQTVSSIWEKALKEDFTVRGGVEYGELYWDDDLIAGPSFVDAYVLESNCAETSRVIFGEELSKRLKDALSKRIYDLSHHPRAFYANLEKRICNYLYYDSDNVIVVSPHSLYRSQKEKVELIAKLEKMKMECNQMRAKVKYIPLLDILHSETTPLSLSELGIKRELIINVGHATPTT